MKVATAIRLSIYSLLLVLPSFNLIAQNCADSYNPTCVDGGSQYQCADPCKIYISTVAGRIKLTREDNVTPADIVCVQSNTVITWLEKTDNSHFFIAVTSPRANRLFTDHRATFYGTRATSDGDKIGDVQAAQPPKECNKYSVVQCPDGAAVCPTVDPKIIVNGGGGGGPKKQKKKSKAEKQN